MHIQRTMSILFCEIRNVKREEFIAVLGITYTILQGGISLIFICSLTAINSLKLIVQEGMRHMGLIYVVEYARHMHL